MSKTHLQILPNFSSRIGEDDTGHNVFEVELSNQDITIWLLHSQDANSVGSEPSGLGREPSTNPNLFFEDKAILIDRDQEL